MNLHNHFKTCENSNNNNNFVKSHTNIRTKPRTPSASHSHIIVSRMGDATSDQLMNHDAAAAVKKPREPQTTNYCRHIHI